jgi:hypothetical protein
MRNVASKLGYYLPWVIVGNILTSIGNGLLSTLSPHTPTARWIGYQVLLGAGRGSGLQMVCENLLLIDTMSDVCA